MILGKIIGRTSTMNFQFLVKGPAKKLDYVWIPTKDYDVLAQIIEIEKSNEESTAYCNIIGYRDGILKHLRIPLEPGSDVLKAEDVFIKKTLGLEETKNGAFIGHLNGYDNLNVFLDLNKLLTKHVAVLAKSGSGKCISPKTKILLSNGNQEEIGKIVDGVLDRGSYTEEGVEISKNNIENLRVFGLNEKNQIIETKINAFMRRKVKEELVSVKTRTGKKIEFTGEHKIPVLEEFVIWKEANFLNKGDYLLIPHTEIDGGAQFIDCVDILKKYPLVRVTDKRVNSLIKTKLGILGMSLKDFSKNFSISYAGFLNWFGKSGIPLNSLIRMCELLEVDLEEIKQNINYLRFYRTTIPKKIKVDRDFSKLFSYLLAEGHNTNKEAITFTNSDKVIREEFVYLFRKIFKITPSRTKNTEFRVYSSLLSKLFYELGFTNSSRTKFVPEQILKSKKECIFAFLEGFIDCDGHIAKNTPSIEINLSSKPLIEGLESMFMRLGIVPINSMKKINGNYYPKINVYGSKNFKILNSVLNLKIKHKKERLSNFSKQISNPNIDIIPNIGNHIKVISNILKMHESESRVNNFLGYARDEKNPSLETLRILIEDIEKKTKYFKICIRESIYLYDSLPKVNEEHALEYLKKAHSSGLSFEKIAHKTNVSGTTVRRMVRGITALTNNAYILAENSFEVSGLEDKDILTVNKINFVITLKKIRELCINLGYGLSLLCFDNKRNKHYVYDSIMNNSSLLYSTLLGFSRGLKDIALQKEKELLEVEYRLQFLKSLVESNLFFDEIVSIERKNYDGYVYDLETETHNFVANNVLVHNSYSVAVLIEEILEKEIPVLVIDPHGEYSSLKYKNDKDELKLKKFKIEPKAYSNSIQEYSPDIENNPKAMPLKLNAYNLNSSELVHLLPARLSNAQLGLLYSGLRNMKEKVDFNSLINELELEENNAKYTLINLIEFIQKLNLFSNSPTSLQELIQPGKCTIINLKGIQTELQEVVVYKLMKDLFEARKRSDIPPFFAIIEEAHNYIPERNFGEAKSSSILRQIASVDYSEPILIKNGDSLNLFRIGEFVDSLMENSKTVYDKNGFETLNPSVRFYTPAFDKKLKIKYKRIKKVIRHRINEHLYELVLEKGKKVRITSSHSVFVLRNNKIQDVTTSSLKKRDYVLTPLNLPKDRGKLKSIPFRCNQKFRTFKLPKKILLTNEFLTLLGYYVAEGGCDRTSIRFALNSNERVYRKEIIGCLINVFSVTPYLYFSKKSSRVDIISHKTSLSELFSALCGNNALESKVPYFIFNVSDRLKASFLRGCFNGDGYLRVRKGNKGGKNIEISYKTISQRLIKELSYLLLSMKIHSAIYEIKSNEKNHRLAYHLVISGKHCERLLNILKNNKHRKKIKESLKNKYRNTNSLEYKIPTEPFRLAYKYYNPIASDDSINERMCIRRERANREDLLKFINYLKKKSRIKPNKKVIDFLKILCNSELGFLRVKSIRRVAPNSKYVYDLSIGESENFISGVGGIILHNSEGRKFGLGLSVISQRPAKIDKSVLSQTGTQIILKVTNPGDIKAIANSVEGLTLDTEKEIKNIPIGTAMITGVVDLPLFVDIRPRKTKHGGEAVDMIDSVVKKDFLKEAKDFDKKGELLNAIQPRNSKKDIELMAERKIKNISTRLIPCLFVNFKDFNVLFNLNSGELVKDIDTGKGEAITPQMDLSPQQKKVFDAARTMNNFNSAEIFSKTGLQFSDVYDVVTSLVKKGYIVQEGNKYKLSQSFRLNLQDYSCYVSPDFSRVGYDEKLEKVYNSEEILRFLETYSKVKNSKECFLIVFGITYE